MENKNIILIALAVFSIVILLSNYMVVNPAYAVSLFELDMGSADGSTKSFWIPSISRYAVGNPASNANYYIIDPVAHTKTLVTKPVIAGRSSVGGLACTETLCYDVYFGGDPNYLVTFSALTGALITKYSVSTSADGSNPTIIIGGVTGGLATYRDGWSTFGCAVGKVLVRIDGTVLGSCSGTKPDITSDLRAVGDLVGITKANPSGSFQLWRITTASLVCTVSSIDAKGLENYNSNWYVVVGTTTINKYSDSCSAGTGITGTGLSNQFIDIRTASNEGVMLIRDTANLVGMSLNSTNISSRLFTIPMNHTEELSPINTGAYATAQHQFGFDSNPTSGNDKFVFVQLGTAESGSGGGEPVVNDCSDPAIVCSAFCETSGNQFLLRCRAEANGGSLSFGNNTTFNPIGGTNDQLVSALGLSNSDIKTNGVGYLLLAVALLLFNSLWIFTVFVMKGRGVVVDNPIYISALISVAIISAFVLMQFTDPLILIVAVVALVALASPKIVSLVSGIRGGGSSE